MAGHRLEALCNHADAFRCVYAIKSAHAQFKSVGKKKKD